MDMTVLYATLIGTACFIMGIVTEAILHNDIIAEKNNDIRNLIRENKQLKSELDVAKQTKVFEIIDKRQITTEPNKDLDYSQNW